MADLSWDGYWQLPPLSRTFATATFVVSACVYTGLLPSRWFIFYPQSMWKLPPHLWRLGTCFLITGPKLGLLFDTYFLYSYLSQLETRSPRFSRKEDLLWYLMFVCGAILVINFFSGMGFVFFLQALILAMCYTVSQDQPGLKVNFMFVTIPAQMAPYAMLLVNLLFPEGGAALMLQLQGLIAGHLFDFLTRIWPEYGGGRNLIPTPAFLSRVVHATGLVQSGVGGAAGGRRVDQTSGRGTGAWRARGPGHRLG